MTMGMTLTPRALLRLFPNASKSTLAANGYSGKPQDYAPTIPDPQREQNALRPLDGGARGEEAGPQRAHLRITRFGSRLLDDDNLRGGAKPLIDCLKESGLIEDDSPKWIDLEVKQELVPAGEERTEIEITWL